jgi:hypothetical protein
VLHHLNSRDGVAVLKPSQIMGSNNIFSKLFDPYERQARLYPGLLAVAPAAAVFICLTTPDKLWSSTLVSLLVSCGSAYALGRVARDAGKHLQDQLFSEWGGPPTTQALRHRNMMIDVHTKDRYHKILAKGIGKNFPTLESETADPIAADDLYRAGTTWLLGQTRDTKSFPLVFKENIAFGFQRNAFGLRIVGIFVSALSFLVVLVMAAHETNLITTPTLEAITKIGASHLVALAISLAFLGMWIFGHTKQALQRTAFAYALRLLESCDHLAQPKTSASRKRPILPTT